jgi:hypothetical protein
VAPIDGSETCVPSLLRDRTRVVDRAEMDDKVSSMAEPRRSWQLAFKIAVFDWIVAHTPPFRRYRDHAAARIVELEAQLADAEGERATLIRSISQLLDERAAHPPT